jgi:hypothetical protein
MSKDSGFIPIPFHIVGKVLLPIGLALLAACLISYITNLFTLPSILFFFALSIAVIGLYLIFVVPRESID